MNVLCCRQSGFLGSVAGPIGVTAILAVMGCAASSPAQTPSPSGDDTVADAASTRVDEPGASSEPGDETASTASSAEGSTPASSDGVPTQAPQQDDAEVHDDAAQVDAISDAAASGAAPTASVTAPSVEDSDSAVSLDAGEPNEANEPDFSQGSRLVIAQRDVEVAVIGPYLDYAQVQALQGVDMAFGATLADGPTFARSLDVSLAAMAMFVFDCRIWTGKFELASVEVEEDVDDDGTHLSIEPGADGRYTLTHDGPGRHLVHVSGTFRAELDETTVACVPPTVPAEPMELPVSYSINLSVSRVASAEASLPIGCAAELRMVSGRNYAGTEISLLGERGGYLNPANVVDAYPLEVIVETEKEAQIEEAGSGLYYDGLIVTGEPQKVRLSTAYGPLLTYQLVDVAAIDGLDLEFWSRGMQYIRYPEVPLAMETVPAIASGRALGARASVSSGGVPLCSPLAENDFEVTHWTPEVCRAEMDGQQFDVGLPGFIATFFDDAGTCELDVSMPGANGGNGVTQHLSAIFVPSDD